MQKLCCHRARVRRGTLPPEHWVCLGVSSCLWADNVFWVRLYFLSGSAGGRQTTAAAAFELGWSR